MRGMIGLAFCFALVPTAMAQTIDAVVQTEIDRLAACPAVYKTSPPPVNARFAWRSPKDLRAVTEKSDMVRIEFTIRYEQSAFFDTPQEAESATQFQPLMDLYQRNFYLVRDGKLTLRYRQAFIGTKWEKQKVAAPEFQCWQRDGG